MRFLTVVTAVALAVVPGSASTAAASPLDLKQVSAEAKWIAHLDVDAMWETTVFEKGWQKMLETREDAKQRLDQLRDRIGMDITKDVHAITAYGTEVGVDSAVLILHAKVNKQVLLKTAENATDHKVDRYRTHEVHTWTARQRGRTRTVAAAFFKPEIVVFASDPKHIESALDVLADREPGIFPDSPLAGKVSPGTVLLMRVSGLSEAELPGRLQMLRQMDSMRFGAGEDKGKMFLRAEAVMKDGETADQAKAMIEGLRAMVGQSSRLSEQAKKMIDAMKVTADGKKLNMSWSAKADEVWEMVDEFVERAAERRAMRRSKAPKEGD